MTSLPLPCVCPVAGVSFRPDTVAACREGDPIVVRRDRHNPHDGDACAVYRTDGAQLGFLPRALAARIAGDGPWRGVVTEVLRGEQATGLRIRIDPPAASAAGQQAVVERDDHQDGAQNAGPVLVRARSGRLLGELAHTDGTTVRVRAADGATMAYPAHLVEIAGPEPAAADW